MDWDENEKQHTSGSTELTKEGLKILNWERYLDYIASLPSAIRKKVSQIISKYLKGAKASKGRR